MTTKSYHCAFIRVVTNPAAATLLDHGCAKINQEGSEGPLVRSSPTSGHRDTLKISPPSTLTRPDAFMSPHQPHPDQQDNYYQHSKTGYRRCSHPHCKCRSGRSRYKYYGAARRRGAGTLDLLIHWQSLIGAAVDPDEDGGADGVAAVGASRGLGVADVVVDGVLVALFVALDALGGGAAEGAFLVIDFAFIGERSRGQQKSQGVTRTRSHAAEARRSCNRIVPWRPTTF